MSEAEHQIRVVREMAARCCEELFAGYGCPLRTLAPHEVDVTPLEGA